MAASKMQRLDSNTCTSRSLAASCSAQRTFSNYMETVVDLELNDTLESREIGEYHTKLADSARHQQHTLLTAVKVI